MKNSLIISILSVFLTNLICIPSSLVDTYYEFKNNRNETITLQIDHKIYGKLGGTLDVGRRRHTGRVTSKEFQSISSILNSVVIKGPEGTELLNLSGDALDTHFKEVETDRTGEFKFEMQPRLVASCACCSPMQQELNCKARLSII